MSGNRQKIFNALGVVASVTILSVALWFLHRELAGLSIAAILDHARSIPLIALIAAIIFAVGSYLVLTGYDAVALRYVGRALPYKDYALTSFIAFAIGHNVGVATLSGGSIRFRMYSLNGLSAAEITRVIAFVTLTFALGASALLGSALLVMPAAQTDILRLSPAVIVVAGVILLALPIFYVVASMVRTAPIAVRDWRLATPTPAIAVRQVLLSIADLSFAAGTLFVLLQPTIEMSFIAFLGIYLLAMAAGLVSSVPGGIGVFEAVLVAALPATPQSALLGTVLVYRLIYYVVPLCLALLVLVAHEIRRNRQALRESSARIGDWLSGISPQLIAVIVFLGGVVLLISGASPAVDSRLRWIAAGLPLPLVELSHLLGSVIGIGLLVLAHGLYRRLKTAFVVTSIALGLGIVVSLLKGLDYEEALILGVIMLAMWIPRAEFYRVGSIATQRFSLQWIGALAIVSCIVLWVSLISFRGVPYTEQLWWQFAFDAQAPRSLRASVAAGMIALAFGIWRLLRTDTAKAAVAATDEELAGVRQVLAGATDAAANIALLGDKRFLWSPDKAAFIMYQVRGDSWIAMGDPVGPPASHEELIWSFRELVDRHDGRPVFYQVSDLSLRHYVDLGLSLSKLGEDARVALSGFSLQGSARAELRQAVNRATRQAASFEVVQRENVPVVIDDLRRVSDAWLADKSAAEKGFSMGSFSERYIENFDCAVVRVNGDVVAFANLWQARAGGELSVDLMRHNQQAPKGVMDYLFAQLMLWGSANNFEWFSLGMAPLSGLEQRELAPLWHKLGHLLFTHGESFYNFEGLRAYKEKFDPVWRSRYLACPGGWLNLPWALLDSGRLISGGALRMVGK